MTKTFAKTSACFGIAALLLTGACNGGHGHSFSGGIGGGSGSASDGSGGGSGGGAGGGSGGG